LYRFSESISKEFGIDSEQPVKINKKEKIKIYWRPSKTKTVKKHASVSSK